MSVYAKAMEMQCQEVFCEGVRTLNAEERDAPATCALCGKKMCDTCAFGVRIPYDVLGEEPWDWKEHYKYCRGFKLSYGHWEMQMPASEGWCSHSRPTDDQRYDALVCSDCFKEEWGSDV